PARSRARRARRARRGRARRRRHHVRAVPVRSAARARVGARRVRRRLAGIALLVSATAYADPPSGFVDPGDLPPLPSEGETLSSTATVLAAASAEEDVVVGAAKREQSLGNVASAVTVVSADRIRRFGYRTVGEAVAAVAGVY